MDQLPVHQEEASSDAPVAHEDPQPEESYRVVPALQQQVGSAVITKSQLAALREKDPHLAQRVLVHHLDYEIKKMGEGVEVGTHHSPQQQAVKAAPNKAKTDAVAQARAGRAALPSAQSTPVQAQPAPPSRPALAAAPQAQPIVDPTAQAQSMIQNRNTPGRPMWAFEDPGAAPQQPSVKPTPVAQAPVAKPEVPPPGGYPGQIAARDKFVHGTPTKGGQNLPSEVTMNPATWSTYFGPAAEGAKDALMFPVNAVLHPIDTLSGIGHMVAKAGEKAGEYYNDPRQALRDLNTTTPEQAANLTSNLATGAAAGSVGGKILKGWKAKKAMAAHTAEHPVVYPKGPPGEGTPQIPQMDKFLEWAKSNPDEAAEALAHAPKAVQQQVVAAAKNTPVSTPPAAPVNTPPVVAAPTAPPAVASTPVKAGPLTPPVKTPVPPAAPVVSKSGPVSVVDPKNLTQGSISHRPGGPLQEKAIQPTPQPTAAPEVKPVAPAPPEPQGPPVENGGPISAPEVKAPVADAPEPAAISQQQGPPAPEVKPNEPETSPSVAEQTQTPAPAVDWGDRKVTLKTGGKPIKVEAFLNLPFDQVWNRLMETYKNGKIGMASDIVEAVKNKYPQEFKDRSEKFAKAREDLKAQKEAAAAAKQAGKKPAGPTIEDVRNLIGQGKGAEAQKLIESIKDDAAKDNILQSLSEEEFDAAYPETDSPAAVVTPEEKPPAPSSGNAIEEAATPDKNTPAAPTEAERFQKMAQEEYDRGPFTLESNPERVLRAAPPNSAHHKPRDMEVHYQIYDPDKGWIDYAQGHPPMLGKRLPPKWPGGIEPLSSPPPKTTGR